MAESSPDFAAVWRRWRVLRGIVWWTITLAVAIGYWGDRQYAPILAGVALAVFAIVAVLNLLFRCPRCGNFFYWGRGRFNPMARRCTHCDLPAG